MWCWALELQILGSKQQLLLLVMREQDEQLGS